MDKHSLMVSTITTYQYHGRPPSQLEAACIIIVTTTIIITIIFIIIIIIIIILLVLVLYTVVLPRSGLDLSPPASFIHSLQAQYYYHS